MGEQTLPPIVFSRLVHVVACVSTSSFLLPNNIPLCGHMPLLFVSSAGGHELFPLLIVVNNADRNKCTSVWVVICFPFSSELIFGPFSYYA